VPVWKESVEWKRERAEVNLSDIDTLNELEEWIKENMPGAKVEEGEDGIVIHTNLTSTMGGYLHERESE
jgi:hypothetical protein